MALNAHLEQISLCAASIAELPFPPPKVFTNALLHQHDITALIRDTEAHERALFSVAGGSAAARAQDSSATVNRRHTTFAPNGGGHGFGNAPFSAVRAPRRNTAVAAVLGGDLYERIRRGGGGSGTGLGYGRIDGRERGELEVDVLLEGAEKLCQVYPIPGAQERIVSMRHRHRQLIASIERYEEKAAEQAARLSKLNAVDAFGDDTEDTEEDDAEDEEDLPQQPSAIPPMAEEDLKREQEEIMELERKKRGLEDRVNSMEKDLAGVLR